VAQGVGPEFKLQYRQKRKETYEVEKKNQLYQSDIRQLKISSIQSPASIHNGEITYFVFSETDIKVEYSNPTEHYHFIE
jgi:hypothetical protein